MKSPLTCAFGVDAANFVIAVLSFLLQELKECLSIKAIVLRKPRYMMQHE